MRKILPVVLVLALIVVSFSAYGQMIKRQDAIWARTTTSAITVDGTLSEAAWAVAESVRVQYGVYSGLPGGGWFAENGKNSPPADPTDATIKFLVKGDSLYVGFIIKDKSVGGGLFNRFDGLLMNMRDKSKPDRPIPNFEYFYGWVTEPWADTTLNRKGASPGYFGWAGGPRTDTTRLIWDAITTVQGISNSDTAEDQSWTTELKISLAPRGYTVSQPDGDIVLWSVSIYDADYQWPLDTAKQSGNRVWLQCPWGGAAVFSHMKIFARPDVTTSSGAVPTVPADFEIPNATTYTAPTIDGALSEPVWADAPSVKIKYGDAAIRNAYPYTLKYRSGQFQPPVNGGQAAVTDPSQATVKYFFKGSNLYLGFDVADRVVQGIDTRDRWDGFVVTLNHVDSLTDGDHNLFGRTMSFRLNGTGGVTRHDDLAGWDSSGVHVPVAVTLKPGTTVDTLGTSADVGYFAEMSIDLTQFGYPAGLGDGVGFLGITYYDGDSFTPFSSSYGTRTWFGRETLTGDGPAWVWMNAANILTDVRPGTEGLPSEFALLGNYPNPFNPSTTISFRMARASEVTMQVFDVLGRMVEERTLGMREPGQHDVNFSAGNLATGVYEYRLTMASTGASVVGRMMLVK